MAVTNTQQSRRSLVKGLLRFGRQCNTGDLTPSLCANSVHERINVNTSTLITARGAVDYYVHIVLTGLYDGAVSTLCVMCVRVVCIYFYLCIYLFICKYFISGREICHYL